MIIIQILGVSVILLISLFLVLILIKHTKYFGYAILATIIALFIFSELSKYSSFDKLFSEQIKEDSIVEHIDISIRDVSNNRIKTTASVRIEDLETINNILEDLSEVKLKEAKNGYDERKYFVEILSSYQVEKKIHTNKAVFAVDEHFVNNYKITNETNHLNTIMYLVENDELEWKHYN